MTPIHRLPDEVLLQIFREVVSLDWLDRIEWSVGWKPDEHGPPHYRDLRLAAGIENDSRCLFPMLFVCKRWLPFAKHALYRGTVHLNIDSPNTATIARAMLNNDDLCIKLQAFAVDWDFHESQDRAVARARWSLLLDVLKALKNLKNLRHLTLCPVPWWFREEIQKAVSQLSCESLSVVVRDGSCVKMIGYRTSGPRLRPPVDSDSAQLPTLVSEATVHEDRPTLQSPGFRDRHPFPRRLTFGSTYAFSMQVPLHCTGLVLRNIRLGSEDLTSLITELALNLTSFSYHEDHREFQGVMSFDLASRLLPMLEQVEELHYVPFRAVENDHDFVPSKLDISQYWPSLRRFGSSDAFIPFRALSQFLSPRVESVEYHISDTENSSSVRNFQALIPRLAVGNPAKIYLYKAQLGVFIDDGFGAPERRTTLDWTSGKLYQAKQSCAKRHIKLRYWKHNPFEEIIGIQGTYIEEGMPQGSLAGISI